MRQIVQIVFVLVVSRRRLAQSLVHQFPFVQFVRIAIEHVTFAADYADVGESAWFAGKQGD